MKWLGLLLAALLAAAVAMKLFGGGTGIHRMSDTGPVETDPAKWRALLQELSDLTIADEELRDYLPPDKVKRRWLGEPPATDADIAAAEARLGVKLPPSYKAFLKVSNGWHYPNSFVVKLAGTSEIGWTRDVDPELVSGWQQGMNLAAERDGRVPPGPEDHLGETLLINVPDEMDDAANFMLNPKTRSGAEMEAWFFSSWNPGANAHRSFWHLMVNVRDSGRHIHESKR